MTESTSNHSSYNKLKTERAKSDQPQITVNGETETVNEHAPIRIAPSFPSTNENSETSSDIFCRYIACEYRKLSSGAQDLLTMKINNALVEAKRFDKENEMRSYRMEDHHKSLNLVDYGHKMLRNGVSGADSISPGGVTQSLLQQMRQKTPLPDRSNFICRRNEITHCLCLNCSPQ